MLVVNVPGINGLNKTKGCEEAGKLIFNTLKEEIYSNESKKTFDNLSLEEIKFDSSNLEEANKLIYEKAKEFYEKQDKVVFLGGDHSISYSLAKAFLDKNKDESCLIVFDAHPDCMPFIKEPTHEEWLRKVVEEGFPTENILLVGTRNSHSRELEFLKEKNIRTISPNQLLLDLEDSCDLIMEFSRNKNLYVSIDIDVIDPAFAPATGYPEIGGLSSREFLYIVQRINKIKNLKAVDIVEINPNKDFNNMTIKLGAKILGELW